MLFIFILYLYLFIFIIYTHTLLFLCSYLIENRLLSHIIYSDYSLYSSQVHPPPIPFRSTLFLSLLQPSK